MAQIERLQRMSGEALLKRGSLSHPLVIQARSVLKNARVNDRKILWSSDSSLDIRVSRDCTDRALRLMAILVSTIELEGFAVTIENKRSEKRAQTVARIYGQDIPFAVIEKVDRVEIASPPKGGLLERVLTYGGRPVTFAPSGKLSVEALTAWGDNRRRWRDGKSSLEDQIPAVVAGFIQLALEDRTVEQKRVAEERERQRRAEERAQLEGLIRAEQAKVRALRNAAANWSRAERIRAFISAARESATQHSQPVEPGTPFGEWVLWAERQADRLDPLKESPVSIVDRARIEEQPSHYAYKPPELPFRFPKPIWLVK
jgi:hypothetical protein